MYKDMHHMPVNMKQVFPRTLHSYTTLSKVDVCTLPTLLVGEGILLLH